MTIQLVKRALRGPHKLLSNTFHVSSGRHSPAGAPIELRLVFPPTDKSGHAYYLAMDEAGALALIKGIALYIDFPDETQSTSAWRTRAIEQLNKIIKEIEN